MQPVEPVNSAASKMMPYQYPNPKEAPKEIVVGSAIPDDERVWVPQAENVWFRPLCLNVSQGYWTNLLRVRKSGVLSRHKHPAPCMAWCSRVAGVISNMTGLPNKAATYSNRRAKRTPCMCRKTWKK